MNPLRRARSFLSLVELDPDVMIAQISAFSRQVPLLYVILNTNSAALAFTHFATAPKLLTLIVPVPMFLMCLIRSFVWWRSSTATFTQESARARLRATIVLTGILGTVYVTWALCLLPYGDAYARCHVAFFISTTVIGNIFCLMHLRPAAFLLTAIVTIPSVVCFVATGETVLIAIAINFLLVVCIMIIILLIYYRDFSQLVLSRKNLALVSDENLRLANLDSLTGIPNRRSFFQALVTAVEGGNRKQIAFAMVDLDGFKPVNDVYGHAAGDRVLIEVARRLRSLLQPNDLVARLGGDEFGILIDVAGDEGQAMTLCRAICASIDEPISLPCGMVKVAASIGLTMSAIDPLTLERLVERADYALYRAKEKCRGTPVLFSDQDEAAMHRQSIIEHELRCADLAAEMRLEFQPIVDTGSGRTVAYEALARWDSPALGPIPPYLFIVVAERAGLMTGLTIVLLKKALEALASWPPEVSLSFNLSVHDLTSTEAITNITTLVGTSGVNAARIIFEITETALMMDFEEARSALLRLRSLGASLSLDDFGTGFSSLNYVHRLPLDTIKVDKCFVDDVIADSTSRKIVKSVVDLCRSLEIACVVEGVEDQEQMIVLRSLGCQRMQGYLFGRPGPGPRFESVAPAASTACATLLMAG